MGARIAVLTGLVLLALVVKTTVTPAITVAGGRPDVLVLVIVGVALLEGPDTGLRLGFGAGLAQDLISGGSSLVGLGAVVMMGVGFAAGRLRPYLVSARQAGAVAVSGVMAGAATLGYGLLGRIFDVVEASLPQVGYAVLVVGLYSAAVSPLVVRPTQAVIKQFPATPS